MENVRMAQAPLKAFISYKWESDSHNQWVETFAKHLRDHGINAILDRWEVRLGDSFTNYMTSKITEADVVLFIMTERSVAAAEAPEGKGGAVKFEMQLAASRRIAGEKMRLIGIYREGNKTPAHSRDHRYVDFRNDSLYSSSLQELIDDLRGVDKRPPLALHNLRAQAPMSAKRFRIAFSFAGEKRGYVAQVAAILAKRFGEAAILYDKYHEAEFSRSDLAFYLPDLYEKEADLVVVVFCPDYDKKEWCGLEWNAVFGLLKARNAREVMLTRFEGAEGTGLHRLADYTDLDDLTPKQASDIVLERLAVNEGLPKEYYKAASSDPLGEDRRPPLAIQNPRAEGARILQILCDEPLDGETLAKRIGKESWHEIQPDVAYLEGQGYVVPNPRNISGRIIYILSITKRGRAFVENGMQPSKYR